VQTIPVDTPELSEERWNAWVQKGRLGDAARVRRWRAIAAGAVVLLAVACFIYFVLPRT
jgi:hypothetical protein